MTRALAILLLASACVAPGIYNDEFVEAVIPLEPGQTEIDLEVVLDIRDGARPDPDLWEWDTLSIDVALPGNLEIDVVFNGTERPRKGGRSQGGRIIDFDDIVPNCPLEGACQQVLQLGITRQRQTADDVVITGFHTIFTKQAAINFFPSTATNQEIRLRVFQR